jgi:hypothetical protein
MYLSEVAPPDRCIRSIIIFFCVFSSPQPYALLIHVLASVSRTRSPDIMGPLSASHLPTGIPTWRRKQNATYAALETRNSYWSCVPKIFTLTNSPRLSPQLTKRFEEIISCATRDLNSIMNGHFVLGQPIFWIGFMDYYITREDSSKLAFTHIAVPTKGTGMQLS